MAVCYQQTGQPEKAFLYMDSARMWTDSLAKEQLTQQIAEFNVKYQTQEKELKIAQLQHKVLQSKMHLLTISIILVLLLMGIVLIILTQRQKRKIAERKLQQIEQERNWNRPSGLLTAWKKNASTLPKNCTTVLPTTCWPCR